MTGKLLPKAIPTLISLTFGFVATTPAHATDLWLGGLAKWDGRQSPAIADGAQMFDVNSPWSEVASKTQVVLFGPGNVDHATDDELKRVFADLRRRNIKMALADAVLVRDAHCQSSTEAYADPGALGRTLEKIKRNGGQLDYLRMDEPFYFGHKANQHGCCHEPVAALAAEVAQSVKLARSIFPEIKIGDVEPIDNRDSCVPELSQWADAYNQAVGERLAFFHADVVWSDRAMGNLVSFALAMRGKQVPFGIIYNADDTVADSDIAWTRSAVAHFSFVESALHIHPDQAIIQTWSTYPSRMLPETQDGTLSHVAALYLLPLPVLAVERHNNIIEGLLLDGFGKAVPGATILFNASDSAARLAPTVRQTVGMVPSNAKTAIVGIRINCEGSSISSTTRSGSATLGVMHYSEKSTGVSQSIAPSVAGVSNENGSGAHIFEVSKEVKVGTNLKTFAVTPGAEFTFAVPMAVMANADHAGYITLIFQDGQGKGILRKIIRFSPSREKLGKVETDQVGRFSLQVSDQILTATPEIRAFFPGNASLRPVQARIR